MKPICRFQTLLGRVKGLNSICSNNSKSYSWKPFGKPDDPILPPFSQRLAEFNKAYEKPAASTGVNIGLPFSSSTNPKTALKKLSQWTKTRSAKEQSARHKQLKLDMHLVENEWNTESRPRQVRCVAQHYGIFQDMFDGAHFNPVVPLDISYDYDDEFVTPVRYGNIIPAKEASIPPCAVFEADPDSLWTLVMSSPDGNLEQNDKELLHWMIGNIPGNELEKGETLCHYLQPFPPKGAGFLRYVFVLYKQQAPVNYSIIQKPEECYSLRQRSFSTLDFYRQFEDVLTPAGLAFFQSEWDGSIRSVFHNVLNMPEPKFEFIHPPPYFPEQEDFAHKKPFNLYLDQYRDVKDLQEEVVKYKLNSIKDPTQPPPPRPKFPNIDLIDSRRVPSWMRVKIQHQRLGEYQWKSLYEDPKE